jgi:hypothetical protein
MILDGVDPREIMWGRPREYEITSAHEAALIWEARLQKEREATARARRKAALVTQWSTARSGCSTATRRWGSGSQFGIGHIPLPESFTETRASFSFATSTGPSLPRKWRWARCSASRKPPLRPSCGRASSPTVIEIGDDVILGDPALNQTPAS